MMTPHPPHLELALGCVPCGAITRHVCPYAGAPLELSIADDGGQKVLRLGVDLAAGERPQAVVPGGAWQSAKSLGSWTLVGCTVAPGFEFARFEIAPPGILPEI